MPRSALDAPLNIPMLARLREAGGAFVTIDDLAAATTGASGSDPRQARNQVNAALDALAAFGFGIDRHPFRGAAYRGPAARLCPDQIEHELGTRRVGRRIAVWERVSSTNDLAALACGSPSNDGLVILADDQTDGRGRLGRSWMAPPRSSILMSILLFPSTSSAPAEAKETVVPPWLTAIGAVATAEVVSTRIGREAAIKWPNDVRVDRRKMAGVLVERPSPRGTPTVHGEPGRPVVIGIGLNVNLDASELPIELRDRATSIRIERDGTPVDRSEIARDLIRRLDHWYEAVESDGTDLLARAWRDRSEHLGHSVRIKTTSVVWTGRLVDLDFRQGVLIDRQLFERQCSDDRSSDLVRIPMADIRAIEDAPSGRGEPWTSGLGGG